MERSEQFNCNLKGAAQLKPFKVEDFAQVPCIYLEADYQCKRNVYNTKPEQKKLEIEDSSIKLVPQKESSFHSIDSNIK